MNIGIVSSFIIYFAVIIFIGIKGYKRVKSTDDYIIGGRSLGSLAGALSAEASDMSAWLFMGLPGSIYIAGTGQAWIAVGLLLGTICNWLLVAKRLRKASIAADDSTTLPGFFASTTSASLINNTTINNLSSIQLFSSQIVRITTSIVIAVFFTIYTASGFVAGSKFFSFVFGSSYLVSLLITVAIILIYTFLGGFLSIAWTSIIQGLLMLCSVVLVPVSAILVLGGITEAVSTPAINSQPVDILTIVSSLAWGLGYFGMPHIIIKYMAIKSSQTIKQSGVIAIIWCTISLGSAVLIGVVGRSLVGGLDKNDSENIFTHMITYLFIEGHAFKTSFIAGLFLCAVLSAIMSTAAAQLLMTSSSVSVDMVKGVAFRKMNDKKVLWLSRAVVVAVTFIGFIIALNPENSIMDLVSDAWAGFGAAFGPLVLLILFWKKVTPIGALSGMIIGAVTVLVFPMLSNETAFSGLYSLIPGFIFAGAVILAVSKIEMIYAIHRKS